MEETGIAVSDVSFATAENTVFPEGKHYVTIFMLAQAPMVCTMSAPCVMYTGPPANWSTSHGLL